MRSFIADARHFQIIYLLFFVGYGLLNLGWSQHLSIYINVLLSAVIAQAFFSFWKLGEVKGIKSAVITALGLALLLRTNSHLIMSSVTILAIATKFLLRFNGKHIFNPSNIGIVLALLFTEGAWVSPGQWGNDMVFLFVIAATGLIVLLKVGRLDITFVFLGVLFVLEYIRTVLFLGWGLDVLIHKFTSGSLMLFAFFMITDPKTTPDNKKWRLIWTIILAFLTFGLSQWFYIYTASIWALVIITPFTILLDYFLPSKKYTWIKKNQNNTVSDNSIFINQLEQPKG